MGLLTSILHWSQLTVSTWTPLDTPPKRPKTPQDAFETPQNAPKTSPRCPQERSKSAQGAIRAILGRFWLVFGYQNGGKLAPKSDQKSISTLRAKNQLNASPLAFSWLSWVEVGSKNRSKIDQKMESKTECLLASIFDCFFYQFC